MTKCPYCHTICNPIRFFKYSRWSPYHCPKCDKKSKFSTLSNFALIVATVVFCIVGGIAEEILGLNLLLAILIALALYMPFMCLMKLDPIETTSEQKDGQLSSESAPSASPSESSHDS